uniref:Uncharacterized protein n=1 Tax=Nothobranchius furzeri TaxID=105023 RepID=A0A8C6KHR8_NOTFU
LKSHRDLTNLVFSDCDVVPMHEHIDLPDIRNRGVSSVVIPLGDGEGDQAVQRSTGLGDDIPAGSLEVKVQTVKCVVVGVAPGPAGACELGNAGGHILIHAASFLDTTVGIFAGVCKRHTTVHFFKQLCSGGELNDLCETGAGSRPGCSTHLIVTV